LLLHVARLLALCGIRRDKSAASGARVKSIFNAETQSREVSKNSFFKQKGTEGTGMFSLF